MSFLKRRLRDTVLLLRVVASTILVVGALAGTVLGLRALWLGDVPPMIRDAGVAFVADRLAGPDVPFDPEYVARNAWPEWGLYSDSKWGHEWMRKIVPFFAYEGIVGQGAYPVAAMFMPYQNEEAFIVGGQAGSMTTGERLVTMNERYAWEGGPWNDERSALATMVHELIHVQGGNFSFDPQIQVEYKKRFEAATSADEQRAVIVEFRLIAADASMRLESLTEATTWEVLAAMCQNGERIACGAFWDELGGRAAQSLAVRMYRNNLGWFYERWADLFLRDNLESQRAAKALRFWADDMGARQAIMEKYGQRPWEVHFIPGLFGAQADTGIREFMGTMIGHDGRWFTLSVINSVDFDDSRVMFGALKWWVGLFQIGR